VWEPPVSTIFQILDAIPHIRLHTEDILALLESPAPFIAFTAEVAPARGIVLAEILEAWAIARKLPLAAAIEELRAQARAAGAVETAKAAGLSDESADQIRSKILGVK
jgi:hypothetical protein